MEKQDVSFQNGPAISTFLDGVVSGNEIVLNPEQFAKGPDHFDLLLTGEVKRQQGGDKGIVHKTHQRVHLHKANDHPRVARLVGVNLAHHVEVGVHLAVVGSCHKANEIGA